MNEMPSPQPSLPISTSEPLPPDLFEAAIRAVGAERYHDKHVFHKLLHGGKLDKGQVQAWALNRYCYQEAVPRKDAALISRVHDRELRREWIQRIHDHDGFGDEPGGIERWLVLTDGLGLRPRLRHLICRRAAGDATHRRILCPFRARATADRRRRFFAHRTLRAFDPSRAHRRHAGELQLHRRSRPRLFQAPPDASAARCGIRPRLCEDACASTREEQEACVGAVRFKCDVLWAQLDVLHHAYVAPGLVPPGAFRPEA